MRTNSTGFESSEMYLKTVAELGETGEPVSLAEIAERLEISPVSTSEMVKRLVAQGFLQHVRYKGVVLTDYGRTAAYNVMRRQRLWEVFLVDHLHLNWAGVYEIACRLEHATSPVVAEALAAFLGHPTLCPHGNPIPDSAGVMAAGTGHTLDSLPVGEPARVAAILPTVTNVYAYLQARDLQPGALVQVLEVAPLQGPLTVRVNEREAVLGRNLASLLLVQPVAAGAEVGGGAATTAKANGSTTAGSKRSGQ